MFLSSMETEARASSEGPTIVVGTPQGHIHEIGALLASATAGDLGWNTVYLGPNLPAEEIAAAALQSRASAVALSLVYPSGDPETVKQLALLRELLGPDLPILVGGRAAGSYTETIASIRALETSNLPTLQRVLRHIAP
jgi:methylmalonyl-CoA mutase cobalamin-binding subunit